MRIAYFINQYPKVSHSFIRREILALEPLGFDIARYALRGWADALVDPLDEQERTKTRYVLQQGVVRLLIATLTAVVTRPIRFLRALTLTLQLARQSDRPLPYHLIYLAEACVVLQWTQRDHIQHLHAHFGSNSTQIVMLVQALGGPSYSFTAHGPEEFDKPQSLGLTKKINMAKFVVGISSFGRSQLFRWTPWQQWNKIRVVHCGLETGFHDIASVAPPAAPRLVCVGRLCEQKGQLLLLEAANQLHQAGVDFHLVLAGDGEMRAEIESRIRAYKLTSQVEITGWISSAEVRNQLLAARAMVLPSFAEGLPVVIMEAMALRRPVISTYVAGIPELVLPGENGWLVAAGDVDALCSAMCDALQTPTTILAEMGDRAYQRVLSRHDIHTEAHKLALHLQGNA